MIKKQILIFFVSMTFCFIPSIVLADVKVSLKLQGGWASVAAGNVNPGTQAFFDWGKVYFAPPSGGLIEGGYKAIHNGYEVGADLIFALSGKLGIGIGMGYLQSSMKPPLRPPMMLITDNPQGGGYLKNFYASTKLDALPVRLSIFLTLPLSRNINFAANAGASWYFRARYAAEWQVSIHYNGPSVPEYPFQIITTTAEEKKNALGFQGGLGIEYKPIRRIAVFIEAQGRYARFRGLEGTSVSRPGEWGGALPSFSEQGKLDYESVPMLPNAPRLIMVQSAPPAGPGGQPRLAVVDFSGVTMQAGVRIYF